MCIRDRFETGANDVLVVQSHPEETEAESRATAGVAAEILIPWVLDHFVLEVDRVERRILVDWQEDY